METIDYEGAWKEFEDMVKSVDHGLIIDHRTTDHLIQRHTTWEPENGEWVYCLDCEKPIQWGMNSRHDNDVLRSKIEPLSKHLPILEYGGFKVGEKVKSSRKDTQYTVTGFKFEKGENAKILLDYISHNLEVYQYKVDIDSIEHLPPEPEEYVIPENEYDYEVTVRFQGTAYVELSSKLGRVTIGWRQIKDFDEAWKKCKARLEKKVK